MLRVASILTVFLIVPRFLWLLMMPKLLLLGMWIFLLMLLLVSSILWIWRLSWHLNPGREP